LEKELRFDHDDRWMRELAHAIYSSSRKLRPYPIISTFISHHEAKVYLPILLKFDSRADGSMVFEVAFVESVSSQLGVLPKTISVFLTAILLATRYKYEVVERYSARFTTLSTQAPTADSYRAIQDDILRIETDSSGLFDSHIFLEEFPVEEDKHTLTVIFDAWDRIRYQLLDDLGQMNEELIEKSLSQLADLLKDYLRITLNRYREIVSI
jgi:hypothetical protein